MSASSNTYPVTVEGVGHFVFRKRMMRDQVAIQAEASRMLGGPVDDPELRAFAHALVTLKTLAVQTPQGWNPEAVDPLDAEETGKLWRVYDAMRDAEERFRRGPEAPGAEVGPAA
jgi:hypothetical protein